MTVATSDNESERKRVSKAPGRAMRIHQAEPDPVSDSHRRVTEDERNSDRYNQENCDVTQCH